MSKYIEITLHPQHPARLQIETALANVQPDQCPKHGHELLQFKREDSLHRALHNPKVTTDIFTAIFNRCPGCVHNWMDNIEAINCAAEQNAFIKSYAPKDAAGKRLPWSMEDVKISPDESLNDALVTWAEKMKCSGLKCNGEALKLFKSEPVHAKELTVHLDFETCPACVLEGMGLTPDEARASFSNFICDPDTLEPYLRKCQEYAAKPKGVLLLHGGVGNGKTHLGAAVLRDRIVRGDKNLLFFKMRHLLDRHWQSIRPVSFDMEQPESPLEQCQRAPFLMLDELDSLPTHFNAEGFLLDLFEERLGAYRPTIITSNLKRAELETVLGTRLFDRLRRASAAVLEFGFESKRAQFNDDYLKQDPRWN